MNDTRARFEEIWPVPECIHWSDGRGMYLALGHEHIHRAVWQNLRLETFIRCQETTDVYVSLVDELIGELDCIERAKDIWLPEVAEEQHMEEMYALHAMRTRYLETLDRAKQIMEQKK